MRLLSSRIFNVSSRTLRISSCSSFSFKLSYEGELSVMEVPCVFLLYWRLRDVDVDVDVDADVDVSGRNGSLVSCNLVYAENE